METAQVKLQEHAQGQAPATVQEMVSNDCMLPTDLGVVVVLKARSWLLSWLGLHQLQLNHHQFQGGGPESRPPKPSRLLKLLCINVLIFFTKRFELLYELVKASFLAEDVHLLFSEAVAKGFGTCVLLSDMYEGL